MNITEMDIKKYNYCQFDTCTVCDPITRGICMNITKMYSKQKELTMNKEFIKEGTIVEIINNDQGVDFPIGSIGIVTKIHSGSMNFLFDVNVNNIIKCCNLAQVRNPLLNKQYIQNMIDICEILISIILLLASNGKITYSDYYTLFSKKASDIKLYETLKYLRSVK